MSYPCLWSHDLGCPSSSFLGAASELYLLPLPWAFVPCFLSATCLVLDLFVSEQPSLAMGSLGGEGLKDVSFRLMQPDRGSLNRMICAASQRDKAVFLPSAC